MGLKFYLSRADLGNQLGVVVGGGLYVKEILEEGTNVKEKYIMIFKICRVVLNSLLFSSVVAASSPITLYLGPPLVPLSIV